MNYYMGDAASDAAEDAAVRKAAEASFTTGVDYGRANPLVVKPATASSNSGGSGGDGFFSFLKKIIKPKDTDAAEVKRLKAEAAKYAAQSKLALQPQKQQTIFTTPVILGICAVAVLGAYLYTKKR